MAETINLTRDQEYLARPTAQADYWDPPNSHVLGGRDLQREVRGTWLGITEQGRIAVLTNFREHEQPFTGLKSRGAIVNSFLSTPPNSAETTEEFAKRLVEEVGVSDAGGFSLAFGRLAPFDNKSRRQGLAIVSNRTPDVAGITWIAEKPDMIHGLSNSHYGDLSWPKVVHGEKLVREVVQSHHRHDTGKEALIDALLEVLSSDTLPGRQSGEGWDTYIGQLRNSIFIPRIGGESVEDQPADEVAAATTDRPATASSQGTYGTQKQTVILVDRDGHVTFVEKTLYDQDGKPLDDNKSIFEFDIEGWNNAS
ncbi:hypothetical protein MBLNU459_g7597t1 [Dothideomycetes sp. NU459]